MTDFQGSLPSRILAFLVTAGLLGGVVMVIAISVGGTLTSELQRMTELRASLLKVEHVAENGEKYAAILAQLERRSFAASFYLKGKRPATAAAEIEQLLKAVVSRRGATIVSTQALPEESNNGQQAVSIKVNIRGQLPQISGILHNVEATTTALFVRNLAISARNSAPLRPGQVRDWRNLDVEFELVGYIGEGNAT